MELGLFTFAELPVDAPGGHAFTPEERLRNLLEEAALADELGLDVYGVGEHHRPDFVVSSPAVALAAAAARTERIRLTSAVSVLSSDDPVRVVSPDDVASVAVTLSSNEEQREESLPPGGVLDATIRVCVPAGGPGHVGLRTPNVTDVHRDASRAPLTGERDRPVGVLLRRATLADEAEPTERCKA